MKLRRIILPLALIPIAALVAFLLSPREPEYQGRTLSGWLEVAYKNPEQRSAASNAVCAIGPRAAIPTLLRMLSAHDPPLKRKVMYYLWDHAGLILTPTAHALQRQGLYGFESLGSNAVSAIPQLVQLLNSTNAGAVAVVALRAIGPEATSALTCALTNCEPKIRADAASCLSAFAASRPEVVPALLKALKDPVPLVRFRVGMALADTGQQRAIVIPALIGLLSDPDEVVQQAGAWGLFRCGPDAAGAIPALQKLLNDPAWGVRYAATNALKKIAGEEVHEPDW